MIEIVLGNKCEKFLCENGGGTTRRDCAKLITYFLANGFWLAVEVHFLGFCMEKSYFV